MNPHARALALGLTAALLALPLAGCAAPTPTPAQPAPPTSSSTDGSATPTPAPAPTPPGNSSPGGGPPSSGTTRPDLRFRLLPVVEGLDHPVFLTSAGDASGRLFIAEQPGRIRVFEHGKLAPGAYLDITDRVDGNGERGLLGFAFDPDFLHNGRVYVHYSDKNGDTNLVRYTARNPDAGSLDPTAGQLLLHVDQPYANHNGGFLGFGPDGYLYLGLGDGGSGGDPQENGQNKGVLLGKILRLDVRGEGNYTVPPDNPFMSGEGRPEIWAYGLRNPWRMSFDRTTGDLWIGDVGQNAWEEINYQPRASRGGENYGWSVWEGSHRFKGDKITEGTPVAPVAEYGHDAGACSVTGGYVYRGAAVPNLRGVYLYGDFCNGKIWGLWGSGGSWKSQELQATNRSISSFGEDEEGELYVVDHGGTVLRIAAV